MENLDLNVFFILDVYKTDDSIVFKACKTSTKRSIRYSLQGNVVSTLTKKGLKKYILDKETIERVNDLANQK
jgi:hypothetical protein